MVSVTLYTQATPNGLSPVLRRRCLVLIGDAGYPISVLLEELGVEYDVKALSFDKKEQKEEALCARAARQQ
jgi:hypothetical protein